MKRRLGRVPPMMAGDRFSAADIPVVNALTMAERLGLAGNATRELTFRQSVKQA